MTRARTFVALFAVAVAILATVGSAPARAELAVTASYFGSEDCGAITISGAAGTRYQIFAEQADGTYTAVSGGMLKESGSVSTGVVPTGVVGNGTPMFMVRAWNMNGECLWLSVPISANDDHLWGWS